MEVFLWIGLGVILLFSFVLLFGAPYLPTLSRQKQDALDLLSLKEGQTLVELGSGDGRMLAAAAERGIHAIGYEINPLLFVYSWVVTRRYQGLVRVRLANFWSQPLPACDGVYVFLLDKFMSKLYKKITQEITTSVKVVSFAFQFPNKKHKTEQSGLYLYIFDNKPNKN